MKWQSDTERREHWGEASGSRRRRIKEETWLMLILILSFTDGYNLEFAILK